MLFPTNIQSINKIKERSNSMNRSDTKTIVKISVAVFILFLCIFYWQNISSLIGTVITAAMPLLIGFVIAYPLNILMSFYERHFFPSSKNKLAAKLRTPLCLVFAIITLIAIVSAVIALIVPQLASCVRLLIDKVPGAIEILIEQLERLNILSDDFVDRLSDIDWQSKMQQIVSFVFSGIGNVMDAVITTVTSVISGVATAFVAIIFAIYLLVGKRRLSSQCKRLMERFIKKERLGGIYHVLDTLNDSFHRFIVGQCTEAVILGALCAIGMMILGLPYAPMIGAVISFTALIPIVGAFFGGAVGVVLIMTESPMQAVVFVIFLVILQQIEGNLIYPKVVGSSIGLPGIWVLSAVTVGGGVFGILGMMIAVPLAAAAYRLLREHVNAAPIPKEAKAAEK